MRQVRVRCVARGEVRAVAAVCVAIALPLWVNDAGSQSRVRKGPQYTGAALVDRDEYLVSDIPMTTREALPNSSTPGATNGAMAALAGSTTRLPPRFGSSFTP